MVRPLPEKEGVKLSESDEQHRPCSICECEGDEDSPWICPECARRYAPEGDGKRMDAAFLQKELDDGLKREEILALLDLLPDGAETVPMNVCDGNTSVMGFITLEGLDKINGDEDKLHALLLMYMGDWDLETTDGRYEAFDGLKFYMGYDLPEAEAKAS